MTNKIRWGHIIREGWAMSETPLPTPEPASLESVEGVGTLLNYTLNQMLIGKDLLPDTDDLEEMEKRNKHVDSLDIDWLEMEEED